MDVDTAIDVFDDLIKRRRDWVGGSRAAEIAFVALGATSAEFLQAIVTEARAAYEFRIGMLVHVATPSSSSGPRYRRVARAHIADVSAAMPKSKRGNIGPQE